MRLLSISGCRTCEPQLIDLRDLVAGMELGHLFSGDVAFCTDFAAEACPVRVDPARLQEVVLALVLNAREALGARGTVLVRIDHLPGEAIDGSPAEGEGRVDLDVSDSGRGMDRATLSKVFQPFFSTHASSNERGLGLSVACGTVRQSGGTIKVFSALGSGTTVRVSLPASASVSVSEGGRGWAALRDA